MNASGYVETLGARLYYQDWGAGEPVLLLHGNAQSHRVFRWYLRKLSPLYRVLLMDSRGHGLSLHREGRGEFSTADMAGDVAALLDHLKIRRCAIIGFSDGANVALEFAARFPDRARAVVAVSGNARPEGLILPLRLFARGEYAAARMLERLPLLGIGLRRFFGGRRQLAALLCRSPQLGEEELGRIRAPVLLLAGTRDLVRTVHTRWMAAAIPNSRLDLRPGGTHGAFFQQKEDYLARILDFFRENNIK